MPVIYFRESLKPIWTYLDIHRKRIRKQDQYTLWYVGDLGKLGCLYLETKATDSERYQKKERTKYQILLDLFVQESNEMLLCFRTLWSRLFCSWPSALQEILKVR